MELYFPQHLSCQHSLTGEVDSALYTCQSIMCSNNTAQFLCYEICVTGSSSVLVYTRLLMLLLLLFFLQVFFVLFLK